MTKDKYFNHFSSIDSKAETSLFLDVLYHDARKGNIFLAEKKADNNFSQTSATKENVLNRLPSFTSDTNYYVSVNTFDHFGKRSESHLYNIGTLYIDVDCHNSTNLETDLSTVAEQLTTAYDTDAISIPTMITFTGRGFGIYYCLRESVNCKSENTIKMRSYLDGIYKSLANQYKAYLEGINSPGYVDMSVIESRRMIRLPGTINSKNGKKCHLIFLNTDTKGNIKFFEDFDAITGLKSSKAKSQKKQRQLTDNKNHNYSNTQLTYMLNLRIEALKKLVELRKDSATPLRELTLFMIYTFSIQSGVSKDISFATIKELNNVYSSPLSYRELLAAVNRPETCKKYKYTTKKIIETLSITPEELKVIKLQGSTKKYQQEQQKIENQKKRTERNEKIVTFAVNHPDITYKEIAEEFKICERTIKRILANAGITRNKCSNKKGTKEEGTKNTLILDVNNNSSQTDFTLTTIDESFNHYLYALSFINYCIQYSIWGSRYYYAFLKFKKHFISYLNSSSNDDLDKKIILNAVCMIADHYTAAPVLERASWKLNTLFIHFYSGKSFRKCKYICFSGSDLKSFPIKDVIDYQLTHTEFVYNPDDSNLCPQLPANIKLSSNRTTNQMSYKEQARYCNVAYLIDWLFPQYFNANNKSFPTNPFQLWMDSTTDSSIIAKLRRVEYHVATFGDKRQIKFIDFINNELAGKDIHTTISLLEKYFKTDLLSLSIDKKKPSEAQKQARKLYHEQGDKWNYLKTNNTVCRQYKKLFYKLKEIIESTETEYHLSDGTNIDAKILKSKYMYRITADNLEQLNKKYLYAITEDMLIREIIQIINERYPAIATL